MNSTSIPQNCSFSIKLQENMNFDIYLDMKNYNFEKIEL